MGAQSAVCGGGRYDGLVEEIGGPATPGIGFAMGLERLLISLETQKLLPAFDDSIDVYVVVPDPQYAVKAFTTVQALRNANFTVEYDYVGRSMKGQMKQANKLMAKNVLIFGSDEVARGNVTLKNMASSEQKEIALNDVVKILKTEVQKHE